MAITIAFAVLEPEQAIKWFLARSIVTRATWNKLAETAKRRAFFVSGVARVAVVQSVWRAVGSAIAQGTTFADFKRDIGAKLEAEWGSKDSPRLENIFRSNVQSAYHAGRWRSATEPEILKQRPYWQLTVILDVRTSEYCEPLADLILPADDPFWLTGYPPRHFQCRSGVITLTARQARRMGISEKAPDVEPLEGWGKAPTLDEWRPDPNDYEPGLRKFLPKDEPS